MSRLNYRQQLHQSFRECGSWSRRHTREGKKLQIHIYTNTTQILFFVRYGAVGQGINHLCFSSSRGPVITRERFFYEFSERRESELLHVEFEREQVEQNEDERTKTRANKERMNEITSDIRKKKHQFFLSHGPSPASRLWSCVSAPVPAAYRRAEF